MNATLLKSLEKLQSDTKLLLKEVSALSSTTYHYRPSDGKWSISQILTHILTAERLSVSYMKKKSLGVDQIKNAGILDQIKFFLLKLSQRIPLRYKAPNKLLEQTPPPLSYGDLIRQWEAVRVELREFLDSIPDENVRKKIYKHPRAGMLDVNMALQFLAEHIHHHRPQIMAIIEDRRKKKLEHP